MDTPSASDIFCGAAPLAADNTLRFAPLLSDAEVIPDLSITAFDEIQAVRVGMNY